MKLNKFILLGLLLSFSVACVGPYKSELIVNIAPNETAFLVPLEGANKSSQTKFMSVDYLEDNKIGTKRISLPQRELSEGRFWYDYRYIPTMSVIKVDRSPVTREWTASPQSGTSTHDDAISVESADSIGFRIGLNITCSITEENASKFLYNYPSNSLPLVMDTNIRGTASSILSKEFGAIPLQACKVDKVRISNTLATLLQEEFEVKGITISSVGIVGGLEYENPEIQAAINNAYVAEMKVKEAEQDKFAQAERNLMNIALATAEAEAAAEFAKAAEAQEKRINLEIEQVNAKARLTAAQRWDGKLPEKIIPQGSSLLFNLGQ